MIKNPLTKVLFTLSFLLAIILLAPVTASAQADFTYADGTAFQAAYCYLDSNYEIIGTPSGGTFSGCGITTQNAKWYFNPITAASGSTTFPYQCPLTYTVGGNTSVSKYVLVQVPMTHSISILDSASHLNDSITCTGAFDLQVRMSYAGADMFTWTPSAGLNAPNSGYTTGVISATQWFKLEITNLNSNCVVYDSIKVIYGKTPSAHVIVSKDTLCVNDTLHIMADSFNNVTDFRWRTSTGNVTDTSYYHTAVTGENYQTTLIINNEYCTDSIVKNVAFLQLKLNLSASANVVDSGTEITLSTTANIPYTINRWLPADLFTKQDTTRQKIRIDSATYITVFGTSQYGCNDSAYQSISINKPSAAVNYVNGMARTIKIYPNPASDYINISAAIPVDAYLADVSGKMVLEQKDAAKMNVASLARGTYTIKVVDKNGIVLITKKIIIAAQ